MPAFIKCNECGTDRLYSDAVAENVQRREVRHPYDHDCFLDIDSTNFVCQRCAVLYYRNDSEEFEMLKAAYRAARRAE